MKKKQNDFCSLVRYGLDTFTDSHCPVLQIQLIDCCLQASGPVRFKSSRSLNALAWFFAMTAPNSPFKDFLKKGFNDISMGVHHQIDWGVLRQVFYLDPTLDDVVFNKHDWFLSSKMKGLMDSIFSDYSLSQLEVAVRRLGCMEVVLNKVREQIRTNPNSDSVSGVMSGFESVDALYEIDCYWRFIKSLTHYGIDVKLSQIDNMRLVKGGGGIPRRCHDGLILTKPSAVASPSGETKTPPQGAPSSIKRGAGGKK